MPTVFRTLWSDLKSSLDMTAGQELRRRVAAENHG